MPVMVIFSQQVYDAIGNAIEKLPQDGRTADGRFSEDLQREQRIFIKGARYGQLKAKRQIDKLRAERDAVFRAATGANIFECETLAADENGPLSPEDLEKFVRDVVAGKQA